MTAADPSRCCARWSRICTRAREQIRLGGGEAKIAAQHAAEKLTARERIALLVDEGTFVELGIHGRPHFSQRAMEGRDAPADGVITGYGKIDGRLVAVAAYDFTVMAGSMGMTGELKVTRLRELALTKRIPFIWLLDSAGARIQEAVGSLFAGSGYLFREEVVMSGVVPQIAALMGPCAAGTAYIPGLADFVPMVKGRGSMALAGPHLVRAAVGEDVTQEELGGSARPLPQVAASATWRSPTTRSASQRIKQYLSFLPAELRSRPPPRARRRATRSTAPTRSCSTSARVQPQAVRHVRGDPADRRRRRILRPQAAVGEDDHHLPRPLRRPPGRDRRQPAQAPRRDPRQRLRRQGGPLHQPLQRLRDPARLPAWTCPASWSARRSRQAGIIRHGAKMLYATANATVPKLTVILRKAYGAGYYVMCGRAYEPDLIVAWPSAEISVMGAEGAVEIVFRKQVEEAEDPEAKQAELIAGLRQVIDPYIAAGNDMIDDVIDPRETRATICRGAGDGGRQASGASVEALRGRAGLMVPHARRADGGRGSRRHHLRDLRRDRQPRAVPGDPVHAGRVCGRGAADRRRGRRPHPHPRPHARRHAELRGARTSRRSARRSVGEVGDAAIINFSTGTSASASSSGSPTSRHAGRRSRRSTWAR